MSLIFNSIALEALSDAALDSLRTALFHMLGSDFLTEPDRQALQTLLARIEQVLRDRLERRPPEGPVP